MTKRTKPKQPRPYYTLLSVDGSPGCPWGIEFGDYHLPLVLAERDEFRDHGWRVKDLQIITTTDQQADIDRAVFELNEATK